MKLTEQTEIELNEICADLPPRQQAFLRTWMLTSQIPLSLTMGGATFRDWEEWKQSSGFIKAYERVKRLRTRRYMFQLRKLLAASLKLTLEMSAEEREAYLAVIGEWKTELGVDLDLIWIANQISQGEV